MNRSIIELLLSVFLFFIFLFVLIQSHHNQLHTNRLKVCVSIIGLISTLIAIIGSILSLS